MRHRIVMWFGLNNLASCAELR